MMKYFGKNKPLLDKIYLIPLLVIFILFKYDHMHLPYFWDEAWSYVPAIKELYKNGPSLLPNSISPSLYRGHPLLFYFLSASWMTLFGDSIIICRTFPMILSIWLIISIHKLFSQLFGKKIGIISTIFFLIQSVFLAQSSFLLPEILLTLLTVLSFKAYFSKNKILVSIWLTLALYTKESGFIVWLTIFLIELYFYVSRSRSTERQSFSKNIWYLGIPIILVSGFFFMQKIYVGWFFFPEHISYINLGDFFSKLHGYGSYIFVFMGRNLLTFVGIIALFYLVFSRNLKKLKELTYVIIFSIFILLYILFSSFNFYSPRYILTILPFIMVIFIYFIDQALSKYKVIFYIVLTILCINNCYFTFTKMDANDHSLGFKSIIKCHQEVVRFCETNNFQDKTIATQFLMGQNLKNKSLGYIEKSCEFVDVQNQLNNNTDIAIISSFEFDPIFLNEIINKKGRLIKRFEGKNCWTEIYEFK